MKHKKDKSMKSHLKRRFNERFGICITDEIYHDMIKQIQNPEIDTYVTSQSVSRKVHKVIVSGNEYKVVYNPVKKELHTVLPKEATGEEIPRIRNDNVVAMSGYSYSGHSKYDPEEVHEFND